MTEFYRFLHLAHLHDMFLSDRNCIKTLKLWNVFINVKQLYRSSKIIWTFIALEIWQIIMLLMDTNMHTKESTIITDQEEMNKNKAKFQFLDPNLLVSFVCSTCLRTAIFKSIVTFHRILLLSNGNVELHNTCTLILIT